MSTVNGKGGLLPVAAWGNTGMRHRVGEYPIASAYGTAIFKGDVVTFNAGNIERLTQASFTAGTAIGVFLGCKYTDPNTGRMRFAQNWVASTVASDAVAMVADDPKQVFLAQLDAATTSASLSKNTNLVQTTAGSATTGLSGCNLNTSAVATTNSLRFRIVGLYRAPDNAWTDTYPKVLVMFNFGMHALDQATGI